MADGPTHYTKAEEWTKQAEDYMGRNAAYFGYCIELAKAHTMLAQVASDNEDTAQLDLSDDWEEALSDDEEPTQEDPVETSYTCPVCHRTSYNPNDVRDGYCGFCHAYTRELMVGEAKEEIRNGS